MAALILLDDKGRKHLVDADGAMAQVPGLGAFDVANLRNRVGRRIAVGSKAFLVLEPSARDLRETMDRGPQVLAPKDLAVLLYEADVRPGSTVLEGGSGSGSLAVALARAVGPEGRIHSCDVREDALAVARRNAERSGVADRIEFHRADLREGVTLRDVDAVLLDLPDPWAAVPAAWDSLRACGHLATFSPNMEQVKETAAAIRRKPFVELRTIELIEREMEVRDVGVRPSFAALGHTGYLTFARKVLETF